MAKKFTASQQQLKPDPRYNSKLVAKFVNCLMTGGKKSVAQGLFYDAMDIIRKAELGGRKTEAGRQKSEVRSQKSEDGSPTSDLRPTISELEAFETAVNNVKPLLEVRSKRIGGASYQVPMQVNAKRQQALAFRWIIQAARAKKGKPMCRRLASELIDAYNKHGDAMTVRENVHRMADANKAFARFAW